MIILLSVIIHSLRQEERSASESEFSMLIVMDAVYVFQMLTTIIGVTFLATHQMVTEPKRNPRKDFTIQTSLVEEHITPA